MQRRSSVVLAAGVLAAGMGVAAAALTAPGDPPDTLPVQLQEPSAVGYSGPPAVPASPEVVARIGRDRLLKGAPWLFDGQGSHSIRTEPNRPSLTFPAGVGYAEALTRIYTSVVEDGRLPLDAKVDPPLPLGVVVSFPTDGSRGVRLSLVAPFGYDAQRWAILSPATSVSSSLPLEEVNAALQEARDTGVALVEGQSIAVQPLEACQTMKGDEAPPAACWEAR